jgi:hypothetical protein
MREVFASLLVECETLLGTEWQKTWKRGLVFETPADNDNDLIRQQPETTTAKQHDSLKIDTTGRNEHKRSTVGRNTPSVRHAVFVFVRSFRLCGLSICSWFCCLLFFFPCVSYDVGGLNAMPACCASIQLRW